ARAPTIFSVIASVVVPQSLLAGFGHVMASTSPQPAPAHNGANPILTDGFPDSLLAVLSTTAAAAKGRARPAGPNPLACPASLVSRLEPSSWDLWASAPPRRRAGDSIGRKGGHDMTAQAV